MGDTWEWDGANWTQMQDVGPQPRSQLALAFDNTRGRTVLFGGTGATERIGDTETFGDTWEWDGSDWTQVQDVGPPARSRHAMAFDSDRQRTVLFGGSGVGALTGDTWEWDGTVWTQVEDVGPPIRELHGVGYATDRKRIVLFGGSDANAALDDTWEWDSTHWTQVQDVGPPARLGSAISYAASNMILFGGSSAVANPATLFGDTWGWDGQHWMERQDMGPAARWLHALTFDTARDRLVLFGGTTTLAGDVQLGDTWETAVDAETPVVSGDVGLASFDMSLVGIDAAGVLTLTGAAPAGGVVVKVSVVVASPVPILMDSSFANGIPGPPWDVPISAGAAATSFRVPTGVQLPADTTFTASLGDVTKTSQASP
jgi:hypothetical protein